MLYVLAEKASDSERGIFIALISVGAIAIVVAYMSGRR